MDVRNKEFKVLDHGFIRVVDTMGIDSSICQAARVSYGDGTTTKTTDEGLINYLLRHAHTTPFEMCEIKLHCKMPLFIARQWLRHRTANVNEYSARYSIMKEDYYVPKLEHIRDQSAVNKQCGDKSLPIEEATKVRDIIIQQSDAALANYKELIKTVARETARIILPVNFYTEFYWKIDLHNFMHFINLRIKKGAQFEIREYAKVLLEILKDWLPMTYKAFVQHRLNNKYISKGMTEAIQWSVDREKLVQYGLANGVSQREINDLFEASI